MCFLSLPGPGPSMCRKQTMLLSGLLRASKAVRSPISRQRVRAASWRPWM